MLIISCSKHVGWASILTYVQVLVLLYMLCFIECLHIMYIHTVSNTNSCSPTFHLLPSLTVLRSGAAFSSNGGSTAVDSGLSRQDNTSTTVKTCLDQSKLKMCSCKQETF